jgi:hypothetical protein
MPKNALEMFFIESIVIGNFSIQKNSLQQSRSKINHENMKEPSLPPLFFAAIAPPRLICL